MLTGLSALLVRAHARDLPEPPARRSADDGRSTECRRLEMLPIECVVRGYLAGSGWKDYRAHGRGLRASRCPPGLQESERLPEPIFTPGHQGRGGPRREHHASRGARPCAARSAYARARERLSLELYRVRRGARARRAASSSPTRSSSSASTPTGGSCSATRCSRPTPRASGRPTTTRPGGPQPSFDKQFVRDWSASDRLGQDLPGPGAARRRRGRDAGALRRGLRAADRDPVRALSLRPEGGSVKATVLIRPKEGILDPAGRGGRRGAPHARVRRLRRPRRPRSSTSTSTPRTRRRRRPRSTACPASCSRTR